MKINYLLVALIVLAATMPVVAQTSEPVCFVHSETLTAIVYHCTTLVAPGNACKLWRAMSSWDSDGGSYSTEYYLCDSWTVYLPMQLTTVE